MISIEEQTDQSVADSPIEKEDYLILELLSIKQSNQRKLTDWTLLSNILSKAVRDQLNFDEKLCTVVKDVLAFLLSEQQLSSAWTVIVSEYLCKSNILAQKAAQQLVTGYRIISNFYQNSIGFPMNAKEFGQCIADSLLSYSNECQEKQDKVREGSALTAIILLLPSEFQVLLFDSICEKPENGMSIMNNMPADYVLQTAYLFLRRKHSAHKRIRLSSITKTAMVLSVNEQIMLQKLIERALVDCHPSTVIDALLIQKSFDPSVAELIINSLPESCYIDLIDIVGSLWGEKLFVSRGDERTQEYLTAALISTLRRISGQQLSHSSIHGLPIASILSAGVSTYLDQTDRRSRLRGMKIANEFSILLGHNIVFDELEEEKKQQELFNISSTEVNIGKVNSANAPVGNTPFKNTDTSSSGYQDNGDSSDSEIEGYDIPDETPKDRVELTNYLRVCLEQLLVPDKDQDAHDKQLSALLSIPRIVRTSPVDAGDVCGPLIKELLRVNNSYNVEDFDELRSAAVQALLVAYPNLAAPVLCWAIDEEAMMLSLRVFAISSLAKAAYTLSGIIPSGVGTMNKTEKGVKIISKENESDSNERKKTIVRRPNKLAAAAKKITHFRNNFGPVSAIFFYPILRIIALVIANNSANRIKKSKPSEKDKKIYENITFISKELFNLDIKEDEPFIRNSLLANTPKKQKKVVLIDEEDGDGLYSMVPVEALLALAVFTKCSLNTVSQSTFTMETMKAAFMMKDSASLSVRRATLTALYSAFESWLILKKRKKESPSSGQVSRVYGVLESLNDVTGQLNRVGPEGDSDLIGREEYTIVSTIVDWAVVTSKEDADEICRTFKLEIIRIAIEGFGLLEDENDHT